MATVLALAGWILYALVEQSLLGEVDRALVAKARLLASTVEQHGQQLSLEFADFDLSEFQTAEHGAFLQLSTARGDLLYRSPSLGERQLELGTLSEAPSAAWFDLPTGFRGRRVTLLFQPELVEPASPDAKPAKLALVLARDARDIHRALATLRTLLAIVGLVTLAIAAAVLIWVVRRSVRPVALVATRIATIGERELSTRLEASGVPRELVPVVERVNELLARLETAFARERAFTDDVAHELRTPLAGLLATLEVTATRRRSEAEYAEAVQEGVRIAGQLQAMVERLLQMARLDAGSAAPETKGYDPAELVLEAWEPFAARALGRGLRVDLDLEDGLVLTANRELAGLVLRNLSENAVTYVDAGGEVRLALARSEEGRLTITVSNSGSRLSPEQAAHATQRFWRGDAARAQTGLHCGLGLALVEKAIGALGGELELCSQVGGEFTARITLPTDGVMRAALKLKRT